MSDKQQYISYRKIWYNLNIRKEFDERASNDELDDFDTFVRNMGIGVGDYDSKRRSYIIADEKRFLLAKLKYCIY